MATGFLYDPRFLNHNAGAGHPESPERLRAILSHLDKRPWFKDLKKVAPRVSEEEWIRTTHSAGYIQRAQDAALAGETTLDTPDVGICKDSFDIAKLAVGGSLALADAVMAGQISNGFALLRPPGHHAEKDRAMGFCLFNNVAIVARYLQKKHGLERILILDWDAHHGNGTQHTFEDDPTVLYISLHQYPFYPGTGALWETGTGAGKGATLNCPMRSGSGDGEFEEAFRTKILPKIDAFKPDAVLISCGFDAHSADPLAGLQLTTEFYAWMSERMMEVAAKYSKGRIISLLEGGYNLDYLPACVERHLVVLSGQNLS